MSQYQLLDSGNCAKLEKIGKYTFVRPSPYAVWEPNLDKRIWEEADITFVRETDKIGNWDNKPGIKDFIIEHGDIRFKIRMTSFGHIGLFPEQEENLNWIRNQIHLLKDKLEKGKDVKVLNLFGYTGGSTLAAAAAGAAATHIDAAKNVVDWARENAAENNLQDKPIRWIVEDATKFVEREIKRGNKYHGIILDPPSFGRGPQGQVFKIETDLMPMFKNLKQILEKNCFVLYTGHTPGFTKDTLKNELEYLNVSNKEIEAGDMNVIDQQGRVLPSGFYARFGC